MAAEGWAAATVALVAAAAAAAVAAGLSRVLIAARLADNPDAERKMHRAPTATAGGLAMLAGLSAGLLAARGLGADLDGAASVAALAAGGAALGLVDDLVAPSARAKLLVMIALALAFAVLGHRADAFGFGFADGVAAGLDVGTPVLTAPAALAIVGSAFWLLVMANATNFLDGANGVAFGSLAISLTGLAVLSALADADGPATLAIVGAGAAAGFTAWNAGTGRLFAGDCGSLGMGLTAGGAGLWACAQGVSVWAVALVFLPILADAILTVVWRARRGRDLLRPHRDHAYQALIRAGSSHGRVALLWWGLTAHCVLSAVAGALIGPIGALAALALNAIIAAVLHAKVRAYAQVRGLDAP